MKVYLFYLSSIKKKHTSFVSWGIRPQKIGLTERNRIDLEQEQDQDKMAKLKSKDRLRTEKAQADKEAAKVIVPPFCHAFVLCCFLLACLLDELATT
jgi:hypothetical protein